MGLLTQEDPIGIAGGLNLYGYANGDPINFSDPFGFSADGGDDPCKSFIDDKEKYAECEKGAKPFKTGGKAIVDRFGERCVAKFALATGSSVMDVAGARTMALGVAGVSKMADEVVTSMSNGFFGRQVRGVSASSTTAVANAVVSGNVGLASASVVTGTNAGLDGSISGSSGWDFLPVVGSLRAWGDVAGCGS